MEKKKYTPGKSVEEALSRLEAHKNQKPGAYQSQWKESLEGLMGQIQNRGPFSYDPNKDSLYRAAVDQHVRLGRKAMMDTMGRGAALTGGYGNSYAATAGQQTYGEYLQALMGKLPEFQAMALRQYEAGGKDLMDRYNLLNEKEKQAFGRYQQILQQYYAENDRLNQAYEGEKQKDYDRYVDERDFAYAQEQDRLAAQAQAEKDRAARERWEQEREYQAQRDQESDRQWQQEQESQARRDQENADRWEREFAENKRRYEQEWAAKHAKSSSGGGGGGGGRGSYQNFTKYQNQHSLTKKEYDTAKKTHAAGPYKPRPAARPWSPSHARPHRPHYRVTIN